MNRRKALKTLSIVIAASYFPIDVFTNTISQKPKHFIGLGDTGYHIINSIYEDEKLSNTHFTYIIDEESMSIRSEMACIKSSGSPIIKNLNIKNSDMKENSSELLFSQQKLKELFSSNHQYILIAGLGGKTGSFWMAYLTDFLMKTNVDFLCISNTPFYFEGKNRLALAQRIVDKYENTPQFRSFSLNTIREKYGNLTLGQAFAKADRMLYKLVSSQATKL